MARPIWNGAISFGLVSIPVKLYSATVDRSVRFHQLDAETGSRVRLKRVRETDGVEVAYGDIVKGYELASGRHVVVTDDELRALDPKASRTIDLLEFVDLESIDPIYYDSAYLLGPDPATAKPYALLLKAMSEAGKVGIVGFYTGAAAGPSCCSVALPLRTWAPPGSVVGGRGCAVADTTAAARALKAQTGGRGAG